MRRFVVIGQQATVSAELSLANLPASSGRLDVLLRCLRAALLVSHGVRRDAVVYLVLLGGPDAPRTVRVEGAEAKFVRPDERSLAVLVQKALAKPLVGEGFTTFRHGIAVAPRGLEGVLEDLGEGALYVLDERGEDMRGVALEGERPVFFLGDHLGFDEGTRAALAGRRARTLRVGPVSLHAEDAIAVVMNELDRRGGERGGT